MAEKTESHHQESDHTVSIGRVRKRPLEDDESDEMHTKHNRQPDGGDEVGIGSTPVPKHMAGNAAVLDEIELHFQRSLSQAVRRKVAMEEDKKVLMSTPANIPPLIQAFEEAPSEDRYSPSTSTCSTHLPTSSVIPLYVCSGSDASSKNTITSTSTVHEEMKLKMIQSPIHLPAENAAPLSTTSARPHVFPSIPSSSLSPGVLQSPTASHLPFPVASTEQLSSKVPRHNNSMQHISRTNFQTHMSPVPPGNHVQVIDLKTWTKSLAGSPSATTSSPSALHLPAVASHPPRLTSHPPRVASHPPRVASHPLRVPTYSSLSASNDITGKSRADNPVSNNVASTMALTDVQVTSNSASPIMLLPSSTMMVQPQPYVLVNHSDLQHVNIAPLLNSSSFFPTTAKLAPEFLNTGAGSGYILVSPNPMLQMVSTAGTGAVQSAVSTPSLIPTTQPVTYMNISTKTVNPFPSASRDIPKDQDNGIDVMPASVEDHFAKALGDQWSKLSTNSNVSPSQNTVIS